MIPGYQLSVISAHISGGVCHLCISGCKSSWVLILIRIIQTSSSYSARLETKLINSCRILLKLSWAVFKVSARWNLLRLSDLWCSTGPLQLYGALSRDEKRYPPIPVNRNWPLKTAPSDYAPPCPTSALCKSIPSVDNKEGATEKSWISAGEDLSSCSACQSEESCGTTVTVNIDLKNVRPSSDSWE